LLDWLYTAIATVLKWWHSVFSTFLDPAGGITWALSIILLVVTIRVALFRLFIRQVKSQRAMQEIQPEIQQLRKQYGADRQGFSQAVMALQKERGVNPLAGCLPVLPQIPVFISLFHVLRIIAPIPPPFDPSAPFLYGWTKGLANEAAVAKLFGAPISASLTMSGEKKAAILGIPGVTETNIRIVAGILIVVMILTSYYTQRQIMRRSGPVEGQAAMVQKLMLYGMPAGLLVSSSLFPIGVLLYWFTNNLWTLAQQFYILRKLPPPGSPAALAKADADRPAVDPKSLAPKPGAKPVRGKPGLPSAPAGPVVPAEGADADPSVTDRAPDSAADAPPPAGNGATPGGSAAGAGPSGGASATGRRAPGPSRSKRKRR
jgi:YidC/Oxa1 family membrane protein insertase